MKRRRLIAAIILVLLAAGAAGGWWFLQDNPAWRAWLLDETQATLSRVGLAGAPEDGLVASGFVEAEEVAVATSLGGRVVAIYADEGDEVQAGQVLVELDTALLLSQIEAAEADLAAAEAGLDLARAGVRREKLDHALAQLHRAQVAEEAARVAWQDAQAMADNPQDLELALTAARAQLGVLDFQARQAQALANAAQAGQDFADAVVGIIADVEPHTEWVPIASFSADNLPANALDAYRLGGYKIEVKDGIVTIYARVRIAVPADKRLAAEFQQATSTYQAWTAWTGLEQAQAARSGAEGYAAALARQVASPLTLEAQAHAAASQAEIAAAAVGLAQAQVEGLRLGATPEQIAAAAAQVDLARAALNALHVQLEQFTLAAPIAGLVLARPAQVGEVAVPGSPLLTLADLDHLTLTVYVPEDQVGRVRLGQQVAVTVDAYPGQTFAGRVAYVASEAEFTPKNVQTREERVNMVFAMRVELPNPEHLLKPGMPADAVLLALDAQAQVVEPAGS